MIYKIAIDGPAGSGKSSISKIISNKYNILFLTSGIFYRACTFILKDINPNDLNLIQKKLNESSIDFSDNNIYINETLIKDVLFSNEITKLSSKYSSIKIVREYVNKILRNISNDKSVIMDGRDIGTVVFPDADIKIFLTASIIERARRRKKDFLNSNKKYSTFYLAKEIFIRDWRDKHRKNDPLVKSKDAIMINTDNKSIEEVVNEIELIMNEYLKCKK